MSIVLPRHLTCKEIVEIVTAYLEGALDEGDVCRFERHLATCPACVDYLDQMRRTIRAVGAPDAEPMSPDAERALLAAFQGFSMRGD